MQFNKIIVDSDILLDHVITKQKFSLLRKLHHKYFCYTTVFNAVEVFSAAKSKKEIQIVSDAMQALKILGLNAKSAKNIAPIIAKFRSAGKTELCGLIAGIAIESKLPIVTLHARRFAKFRGLRIIDAKTINIDD